MVHSILYYPPRREKRKRDKWRKARSFKAATGAITFGGSRKPRFISQASSSGEREVMMINPVLLLLLFSLSGF